MRVKKELQLKKEKRCVKCGSKLYKSEIEGYTYQCFKCDEDFYTIEQGGN